MLDDKCPIHPLVHMVAECQATIRELIENIGEGATEEDMNVIARVLWDHVTGLPHEQYLLPRFREGECPICFKELDMYTFYPLAGCPCAALHCTECLRKHYLNPNGGLCPYCQEQY